MTDAGKIGQINVTGLGLPSEMAGACRSPARRKSFAIWNPIDLGYAATMIAYNLANGTAKAEAGRRDPDGPDGRRSRSTTTHEGAMADPFIYDAIEHRRSSRRSSDPSARRRAAARRAISPAGSRPMPLPHQPRPTCPPTVPPVLRLHGISKSFPGVQALVRTCRLSFTPAR